MRTVVLGPRPPELDALIARRRSLGLDTHDEVWKGEYHMAPAAVVVEIESPDDETWDKLDFYADHGVDGLLIVSAEAGSVTSLVLKDGRYERVDQSQLLGPESRTLADRIEWPADIRASSGSVLVSQDGCLRSGADDPQKPARSDPAPGPIGPIRFVRFAAVP